MVPAVFDQTSVEIEAGRVGLRASGQVMKFAGFLEVYAETVEDAAPTRTRAARCPIDGGRGAGAAASAKPEQHFTQPPPRFSEATLVKELEEKGIGRPSTYAAILSTVQDRGYVEKKEGRLHPTDLGVMVNSLLVKSFPGIVSSDFTAQMEEQLDQVEEGAADWVKLLHRFYEPFKLDLEKAKIEMRDLKSEEEPTERDLREVRQAHGHQVGAQRPLPGLHRLPGVPQHQGVRASRGRHPADHRDDATDRSALPDLRLGDGDPARAVRRVPGLLEVSGVQDHGAHLPGRGLSEAGLRRLPDREALAARQGLLRLLELLEDPVRFRVVGSPGAAAVPRSAMRRSSSRRSRRRARGCAVIKEDAATTPSTPRPPRRTKPRLPRRPAPGRGALPASCSVVREAPELRAVHDSDRRGDVDRRVGAVPELPVLVVAPAADRAVPQQCAGELIAHTDRNGARQPFHRGRRCAQLDDSPVANLPVIIGAPAKHGSVAEQGAGVIAAGGDGGDTGEAGHGVGGVATSKDVIPSPIWPKVWSPQQETVRSPGGRSREPSQRPVVRHR